MRCKRAAGRQITAARQRDELAAFHSTPDTSQRPLPMTPQRA